MTSIGYIVDGDLEKNFISECCKGFPIRKIGNGDKCPAHVIAKQSLTHINLLKKRVGAFVIFVDLEKRQMSCGEFASEIMTELKNAGLGDEPVTIFVKEREIEDWILADHQAISELVGETVSTNGIRGKGGLAKLLKNHGVKYNEVVVGVPMLKAVHVSRANGQSESLDFFCNNFPADCWWLKR